MSLLLDRVRAESEALSPSEKQRLALELLEACAGTWDTKDETSAVAESWDQEIAKRIGEIETGQAELIPWDSVKSVAESRKKWPAS